MNHVPIATVAVATVLTVYGIETSPPSNLPKKIAYFVATVLTVYGIETEINHASLTRISSGLQQSLPFTVLKRNWFC